MSTAPHEQVPSVMDAMAAGPRYLWSAWPLRALVANLLAGCFAAVWLLALVPVLLLGITRQLRAALWTPLLDIEAARLSLVDPELAEDFRDDVHAAGSRLRLPRGRHVAYIVCGVIAGSIAFWATVFLVLLVGVLLASPWLIDDGPVTVVVWHVTTPTEARVAVVLGVLAIVGTAYALGMMGAANSSVARLTIADDPELRREVARLSDSRAALLEAVDHERQRIERELHDRVQHRLVALAMTLGIAEEVHRGDPTGELAARAHEQLDDALAELRSVILGIQPRALTEHGLSAAVTDLVGAYPVDVRIDLGETESSDRLPPAVEQAGYLLISECLTNVVKHSGATEVEVRAERSASSWTLTVTDNGSGNAELIAGRGLASLANRIGAVDGTLTITSPDGGPTVIAMRCPLPTS